MKKHIEILKNIDYARLNGIVRMFLKTDKEHPRTIFLAGNGGSSATCSHFAQDLATSKISAINLSDNMSRVTAIGNDFSYEDIFVRQLEQLRTPNSVLFVISASGNSKNLIKAVESQNLYNGETIGSLGFDGGVIRNLTRVTYTVNTEKGEYELVEDIHSILCHYIALELRKDVYKGG